MSYFLCVPVDGLCTQPTFNIEYVVMGLHHIKKKCGNLNVFKKVVMETDRQTET